MFKNIKSPTMNELVNWFQIEFTELANSMKTSTHNAAPNEPNPYHIEDLVWAHTMMVCQRAEIMEVPKINLICALLHDIGKPGAREEIPFEAKKPVHTESNEIRNDGKNNGKPSGLQRVMPASGIKTHFRGHEGLSAFLAIEVLEELRKLGMLSHKEVQDCLTIISMHGSLFDNISEDGEMKKPFKVFDKFDDVDLFGAFVTQVKCDSLGRFFTSKDGRKNNAHRLGTEIFTQEQFLEYKKTKEETFKGAKNPFIVTLVGLPGSGKSTWLEENITQGTVVVSRDDALMEYAEDNDFKGNYSQVWKWLTDNNLHSEVDKMVQVHFRKAVKYKQNIVVDMTNMSNKTQRKWTNSVPKEYLKEAVVFATTLPENYKRLDKREAETGKSIPKFVVENMMKGFMVPNFSNFDRIHWIF